MRSLIFNFKFIFSLIFLFFLYKSLVYSYHEINKSGIKTEIRNAPIVIVKLKTLFLESEDYKNNKEDYIKFSGDYFHKKLSLDDLYDYDYEIKKMVNRYGQTFRIDYNGNLNLFYDIDNKSDCKFMIIRMRNLKVYQYSVNSGNFISSFNQDSSVFDLNNICGNDNLSSLTFKIF